MSSIYRNPNRNKLTGGYSRYYPGNPNPGIDYYKRESENISQGMYYETAIGKACIDSLTRYVIGRGLTPMASPERSLLPWTDEETTRFIEQAESFYRIITGSADFDWYGKNPFRQLQQIAMKTICIAGDILLHTGYRRTSRGVRPFVQVISGKMVRNPGGSMDTRHIAGGVKLDPVTGREEGYYVMQPDENLQDSFRMDYFPRYTSKGRKQFDLVSLGLSDPLQLRGIPVLEAVKDDLLGFSKYKDLHLAKAAVQALFSVFIQKDQPTEDGAISFIDKVKEANGLGGDEEKVEAGDEPVELGYGNIIEGNPGEKLDVIESQSQASDFEAYAKTILGIIAPAAGGLSYEMLLNSYNASFSASRATINSCEQNFRILRDDFTRKVLDPVYRLVIEYGILSGHIEAPGYLEGDRLFRDAVTAATWVGVTPIQVDPTKEVKAYSDAISAGFCTREIAARNLYGIDVAEVFERLRKEKEEMEKAGIASGSAERAAEEEGTEGSAAEEEKEE